LSAKKSATLQASGVVSGRDDMGLVTMFDVMRGQKARGCGKAVE
jgi:hypothetical protein